MTCEVVNTRIATGKGAFKRTSKVRIIVCSRGKRWPACSACGAKGNATKLCDGPGKAPGKTCDAKLCNACATALGPDRDLCPACLRAGGAAALNAATSYAADGPDE